MPFIPASFVGAAPTRPLTAARPASGEAQTTLPPSAATWAAKFAGATPVNETICRPVATTPALDAALIAIAESCGARATAGSDGTRASYTHAAVATTASVASPGTDLTIDTGRLTEEGDGKHGADCEGRQLEGSTLRQAFPPISRCRNSRTRGRARRPA